MISFVAISFHQNSQGFTQPSWLAEMMPCNVSRCVRLISVGGPRRNLGFGPLALISDSK